MYACLLFAPGYVLSRKCYTKLSSSMLFNSPSSGSSTHEVVFSATTISNSSNNQRSHCVLHEHRRLTQFDEVFELNDALFFRSIIFILVNRSYQSQVHITNRLCRYRYKKWRNLDYQTKNDAILTQKN